MITIRELLDHLDGNGLVITDERLLEAACLKVGLSIDTGINTEEPDYSTVPRLDSPDP